ncbi:MAG: HEAT repeat domain-containing protein [Fimbriimonadales bacterium]
MRVAFYGWGEFEVVWNPCEESLGALGALAPCQQWLNEHDRFESYEFVPQRRALVKQLERLGADAVPQLIQALKDTDMFVQEASAEALGNIKDPRAVPYLIETLEGGNDSVRAASARALGNIGDPQAVPYLIKIVSKMKYLQYHNRLALEGISPTTIPMLGDDPEVRQACIEALGQIGDSEALYALERAFRLSRDPIEQDIILHAIKQVEQKRRESGR